MEPRGSRSFCIGQLYTPIVYGVQSHTKSSILLLVSTKVSNFGQDCSNPSAIRLQVRENIIMIMHNIRNQVPYSVVVSNNILQPTEQREAIQLPDFIIRKIYGVKLILEVKIFMSTQLMLMPIRIMPRVAKIIKLLPKLPPGFL